mgnify:FL=1
MKIIRKNLEERCRIICVSDIHGRCGEFAALLEKCGYKAGVDYLFILGDLVEKGSRNIETIRLAKSLSEQSDRVVVLKGNNDTMCGYMAFSDDRERFMKRLESRPKNTFCEMAQTIGITDFGDNFDEKRQRTAEAYSDELDFLEQLPLALETDGHIFVHAGIENRSDWENSDMWTFLSAPWFLRSSHPLEKYVVVGHFPTYNFSRSGNTNFPIIDRENRIIGIDGGCEVKWAGQLNAFIINKNGGEYSYETVFMPLSDGKTVKKDWVSLNTVIYCDYEKDHLEILGEDGDFLQVKIIRSGKVGRIPKCMTGNWNGALHGWINLNSFVSAKVGETFYQYGNIGKYAFGIHENGQVGMIPQDCI